MSRSLSISVNILTLIICSVFVALPDTVNSVLYNIKLDPDKFMIPCKPPRPIENFFDFSNATFYWADDNSMIISGSVKMLIDVTDSPLSISTSAKKKTRGRWIDTPFSHHIKDLCAVYYEEGRWWYEQVTKHFVGDQRECPPKKNVVLPFNNATVKLNIDVPTHMPTGEFVGISIFKQEENEACFELYADMSEA